MKLLINTESLSPPLTGIGNYTFNLLSALEQMDDIERIDCFSGFTLSSAQQTLQNCRTRCAHGDEPARPPAGAGLANRLKNGLRQSALAYRAREALRNGALGLAARRRNGFIYHEPSFILKAHQGPSVATVHDLSFIRYPQFHPPKRVEWLVRQLPKTLDRADAIITDSEYIRQELIQTYRIEPGRVTAIHLGVSELYHPARDQQGLDRYGLRHGEYLFFVGTLEPRKGIDLLLDAWSQLPCTLQKAYPLVLAGAPGWNNETLQARIQHMTRAHGLKHLRFVPESSLPALYSGAALFVFPSLYEGFGLPLLEAMSCGAPTICSAETSMAEFSQGAACLFDRGDSAHLAERIQHLLERPAERNALAQLGQLRSRQLSWRRCAQLTCEIYRQLAP
ncbi:glycosyltransferase family 4 protein [Stutzerimonas kunmingensis]|uniref:glycosyltransferase family 4 protein n=1 Tax=Stutzerimonas kunmingensis TaxID=1211807 RepID=UPI00243043D6|nr:glycosyltransferase family 1 protein [Stutzerimonas kunmingensis]